ncbi:hypothetical protein [Adlercreutzia caecimuris]|uniref:Uncharacterized protein n=1 Tax=Adlercreutzia caecimuris B7 TaxID=1235794 RepID=R9L5X8_9ACTN|nr:hypothetical protein [Adlercreutzia caecimuris]EOS51162.1 hypothetical protein C811_01580 [Adlercreutzia caecimuris B7]
MVKKNRGVAIVVGLCLIPSMLSGCLSESIDGSVVAAPSFEYGIDTTTYDSMRSTTPHHINETVADAIFVDAEVILPEAIGVAVYNAEPALLGVQDRAFRAFFPEEQPDEVPADSLYWKYDDLTDLQYEEDGGDGILVGCDSVGFSVGDFVERYDAIDFNMPDGALLAPYAQEELVQFSSQEAVEHAQALLRSFGINEVSSIEVYALSAGSMQQVKEDYVLSMQRSYEELDDFDTGVYAQDLAELERMRNIVYTTEDEMYSVHVHLTSKGVPLNTTSYGNRLGMRYEGDEHVDMSFLHIYVGKEGIRRVDSRNLFTVGSKIQGKDRLISVDEALNVLATKFGSIVGTDSMHIDEISLEYCAMPDSGSETGIVLVPAWVFQNADDPDYGIRVNALTAEVI